MWYNKCAVSRKTDSFIKIRKVSRCGGIGRRTRLKIVRETIRVRLPSAAFTVTL